jgi:hypothetical protein
LSGWAGSRRVWDTSRSSFPEARVYYGIDGVREWFRGLPIGISLDLMTITPLVG